MRRAVPFARSSSEIARLRMLVGGYEATDKSIVKSAWSTMKQVER
jgi:hypothetical protein